MNDKTDKTKTELELPAELPEQPAALELGRPSSGLTMAELATLEESRGRAIIERRTEILQTLRRLSIQLTMPPDWLLFRAEDRVTGYLSDQGCDRIKGLWGIQIENIRGPELIEDTRTGEFAYSLRGDGHCKLTGESVFDMEGVRYSTDDFARQKPEGIQRRVAVQKAARANLDGSITRELAGMRSVPVQELDQAWAGTWKSTSSCALGRGFSSKDARMGAPDETTAGIAPADVPVCDLCQIKLVYRPAKKFWGCPNYKNHPETKVIVDHQKLLVELAKRSREPGDEE